MDLVALPDIVKKDLSAFTPPPAADQDSKPAAVPPPIEAPPADEMVLKPKDRVKDAPKEAEEKPKTKEKDRQKKLSNALDRIRSLERLKREQSREDSEAEAVTIKGNQISRGTSLSGDARVSLERSYYDDVREALLANWTIPAWLTRQKYSAQVQITVSADGMITGLKFMKSSGNDQFDAEVRNTLKQSQPLPKPPSELEGALGGRGILVGFPL